MKVVGERGGEAGYMTETCLPILHRGSGREQHSYQSLLDSNHESRVKDLKGL